MIYDMLPYETVKRVWEAFQAHSACINKKYEKFKGQNSYWTTDRERFVGRFFKKYAGKYIAFIDKVDIGCAIDSTLFFHEGKSFYSRDYRDLSCSNYGERITRVEKKYLRVDGFRAVNELYGVGYIEMSCTDMLGDKYNVRLDHNNLLHIQFKEIGKLEYEGVARLFEDDREDRAFRVIRCLSYEEIKARKGRKKVKETLVKEEVEVMAKDIDAASKMLPNTINVERI